MNKRGILCWVGVKKLRKRREGGLNNGDWVGLMQKNIHLSAPSLRCRLDAE